MSNLELSYSQTIQACSPRRERWEEGDRREHESCGISDLGGSAGKLYVILLTFFGFGGSGGGKRTCSLGGRKGEIQLRLHTEDRLG